jgi:D-3-phosphoglycerate dehydrogenase
LSPVSVLAILADENINVIDMLNKSRAEVAYNLIDIDTHVADEVLEKMRGLDGVINVRLIGDCA